MADIKDRAREYLAKNSEYSEVYEEFFVAVDTMTAMIEFAEQETKLLSKHILELQADKGRLTDRVKDLEKENAELKHIIATLRQEKDNVSMHAKAMEVVAKTRSDQLTKAKEIIKKLYAVYYDPCVTESDLKYRDELFAEINQFLSEVEQWKK